MRAQAGPPVSPAEPRAHFILMAGRSRTLCGLMPLANAARAAGLHGHV